jgi:hypothetical protein
MPWHDQLSYSCNSIDVSLIVISSDDDVSIAGFVNHQKIKVKCTELYNY